MGLHGAMHQLRRMAVYDEFCRKKHAVLIATDVAARGLGEERAHVEILQTKELCMGRKKSHIIKGFAVNFICPGNAL